MDAPVGGTREATAGLVPFPLADSDPALVKALRAGHRAAATALFDRYGTHVQRVLARVMGPDPELDDLVQEVFVAALTSVEKLDEPQALRGWLTSIAVFTARSRIRRRQRWRFLRFVAPEELPELEQAAPDESTGEALRATYAVLRELDADDRIAFALRYVDGMELTEVAATVGVSLATIKRRLQRASHRFVALARSHEVLRPWLEGGRWQE